MSKWILIVLFVLVFFGLFTATVSADQEDYKHWADKAPTGWQNGALQQTNSEYYEGEVVPHYWTSNKLVIGNTYAFNIYYDYYNPSKACGFDYLAQYNLSRTTTFLDATPTIDDAFSEGHGNFYTAGADITFVSPPIDFSVQRVVTVIFTATAKKAEFYWGLHLSEPGSCCPTCSGAHGWPGASLQSDVRDVPAIAGVMMLGGGGSMQINPNAIMTASISGYKLDECTGEGLPGWAILLCSDPACTSVLESTTTNASGFYIFSVTPGTYYVHEVLEPGWYQTAPSPQTYYGPLIVSSTTLNYVDQNFRNHELLCISGYKRIDGDGDGTGESVPTEPWDITLTNISGYGASTTTDTNGYYEFCGLYADTYTVTETVKSGWTNVTPSSLDVPLRCTNVTEVDFVNKEALMCLSGYKLDENNGPQAGWVITVEDAEGVVVGTDTTDAAGYWEVCGLIQGVYNVSETMQAGWVAVDPADGNQDITLVDQSVGDVNFTNKRSLCLSGYKLDENNGPQGGWVITVEDAEGVVVGTDTTDAAGYWEVCGLIQGVYNVSETMQAGWVAVDPADGNQDITLVDQSVGDVNFTNKHIPQYGNITGMKGDQKCPECGLEGWEIKLINANTQSVVATDITGPDGKYEFLNIPFGTYWVNETLIFGWKQITPNILITLNATNPEIRYNFINAKDENCCICPPTANFTFVKNGYKVQFTDTSTGPKAVRWIWLFGDGTMSSLQNPQKTFSKSGTYTVKLYITWADCDGITYTWKSASQRIRVP